MRLLGGSPADGHKHGKKSSKKPAQKPARKPRSDDEASPEHDIAPSRVN